MLGQNQNFSHDYHPLNLDLTNAAHEGISHSYPSGVELFGQDECANDVFLVHSGLIKLTRSEANGNEILLDIRCPGSLIGSAAVITERPHPFTAITVTHCSLTRWGAQQFLLMMAADASLSACVRNMLSDEVLHHVARISQLTCLPARQRLEQFLWQLCERFGDGHEPVGGSAKVQLPLKHYEIAEMLSITPTYLCRLLNALEDESLIARRKGWIVVNRSSDLWHMSLGDPPLNSAVLE